MDEKIRTIEVEFLRPGPPHNQLLSPLTQYLAVCGDAGAGTVSVPFEQAAFNRRLSNLRYADNEEDESLRLEVLRTTGADLGSVLDEVPGFVGSLEEHSQDETLVNLRIITSASELALLPFELAKVPIGAGRPSNEWLGFRAGIPICISRRVRSVAPTRQKWPRCRPRVLFIVGLGIDEGLRRDHHNALEEALRPWRRAHRGGEDEDAARLDVLAGADATMANIREHLKRGYTSIHILAHGAETENTEGERYGLLLKGQNGTDGDVVTGERFASAFRSIPASIELPATVVAASCDSAFQADVLVPGGSFAHELHLIGIPLVVASQFPLTFEGSIRLVRELYDELFWGTNPLPTIARLRASLHADLANTHDWASLVVYDALPADLDDQLEEVRHYRAKNAVDDALAEYDARPTDLQAAEVDRLFDETVKRADYANSRLPDSPLFEMEVAGLRGSYAKRMSERFFTRGQFSEARRRLEESRHHYRDGAALFCTNKDSRKASLNWLETQAISLDWTLGKDPEAGSWEISMRSCLLDLENADHLNKAWAHCTMAELYLLALFTAADNELDDLAQKARDHTRKILDYYPRASDFPVFSTRRQLLRYVNWWGSRNFVEHLGPTVERRSQRWGEVVALAQELADLLDQALKDDTGVQR